MELRKHYSRPPITEAVIDVRVDLSDEVTLETLARVYSNIEVDYPDSSEFSYRPVPPNRSFTVRMRCQFKGRGEPRKYPLDDE